MTNKIKVDFSNVEKVIDDLLENKLKTEASAYTQGDFIGALRGLGSKNRDPMYVKSSTGRGITPVSGVYVDEGTGFIVILID